MPEHSVDHRSVGSLREQLELAAVRDRDMDREVEADWQAVVDQQSSRLIEEPR